MRIFFFLLLLQLAAESLWAQEPGLDSIINKLRYSTPSTYRANFKQLDSILFRSTPALLPGKIDDIQRISKSLRFQGPAAAAFRMEAIIYKLNRQLPKALEAIAEASRLSRNYRLPLELADNLDETGNLYSDLGQPDSSLHYFLLAANLYKQQQHPVDQARMLYKIGNIFYNTGQYKTSLSYLENASQSGGDSLDARTRISILNTVALIHRNLKNYPSAIEYQNRSLQLAQTAGDSAWIGINHGNLGRIYKLQGKFAQALKHYQINLAYSQKFKIWGDVVVNLSRIAILHLSNQNIAAAKNALDEAYRIALREDEYDGLAELYRNYMQYYQQLGRYDSAFYYQQRYYTSKDSLDRLHFNTQVEKIRATFEFDKNQAEINLLKRNNAIIRASEQKKNTWLLIATFLLVCTSVCGFLLYRNDRQKHKANQLLVQQQKDLFELNEEINRQNEEIRDLNNNLERIIIDRTQELQIAYDKLVRQNQNLEQFAYIISHNLRSPIAQILGLVSLFDEHSNSEAENRQMLEYLNKAARNLDTIVNDLNDLLIMRNQADNVREEVDLAQITQAVKESLKPSITNTQAEILTDFSGVKVVSAIRSYITSILYNLISNAIKYRNPERTPVIQVSTTVADNQVCLLVQDNGLGIDLTRNNSDKLFKLYHRFHFHTEGKGMGLFIVREQVESMNGRIEVESQPGEGTTFKVYLSQQAV